MVCVRYSWQVRCVTRGVDITGYHGGQSQFCFFDESCFVAPEGGGMCA